MDLDQLLYGTDESEHEPDVDTVLTPAAPPPPPRAATPPPPTVATPPLPETAPPPPPPPASRAVSRPRPKRPRKPSVLSLRHQGKAFDYVAANLPYVLLDLGLITTIPSPFMPIDDDDYDPIDLGDDDSQRVRTFLKRTILLSQQAYEETVQRTEYRRLLKHHSESAVDLHKLMRGLQLSGWFWMGERWRALTIVVYKPLVASRCYATVTETFQAIRAHTHPDGTRETDAFGFRGWYRLDDDAHCVRFSTRTTMHAPIEQLVDLSWSILSDGDVYKQYHLGDNCDFFHQVVQQISPDMMVIQMVEKYPTLEQMTHSLALVFRVQTETGYLVGFRSIESPQLHRLMKEEGLSAGRSFFWETFDVSHRNERGVCDAVEYTLAGSIGSDNPTYARRWCDEILIAMVRSESKRLGTPLLPIESSTEEDSVPNDDSEAKQSMRAF